MRFVYACVCNTINITTVQMVEFEIPTIASGLFLSLSRLLRMHAH